MATFDPPATHETFGRRAEEVPPNTRGMLIARSAQDALRRNRAINNLLEEKKGANSVA